MNARSDILQGAEKLVNGDRNNQYGDPLQDFRRTAALWSAWKGVPFEPHEVATFMVLLKLSRISWTKEKEDSWMDAAGYIACGWDCVTRQDVAAPATGSDTASSIQQFDTKIVAYNSVDGYRTYYQDTQGNIYSSKTAYENGELPTQRTFTNA